MTARAADTISTQVDETSRLLSAGYRRMTIGIIAVVFLIAFEAMAVAPRCRWQRET